MIQFAYSGILFYVLSVSRCCLCLPVATLINYRGGLISPCYLIHKLERYGLIVFWQSITQNMDCRLYTQLFSNSVMLSWCLALMAYMIIGYRTYTPGGLHFREKGLWPYGVDVFHFHDTGNFWNCRTLIIVVNFSQKFLNENPHQIYSYCSHLYPQLPHLLTVLLLPKNPSQKE